MRSMLVIGLGRFGENLAKMLAELDNEVMVVDSSEENVNKIAPYVTRALIGDCMDENILRSLGVEDFDVCFVCISEHFQSSLEITSLLKDLGAKCVVSKTDRDLHAKFLRKLGADAVVHPERDMALRTAIKYTMPSAFDYIELTPEYAIFEIGTPASWVGKTIRQLDIRTKYQINIIGVKENGQVVPAIDPNRAFTGTEHLLIAGNKKESIRLMSTVK
jgi:trk system potassium uptake protein TrkA